MSVDFDRRMMAYARKISTWATCPRLSVGAVIVRNGISIAEGYNAAPHGRPQCKDIGVGCLMDHSSCRRTVHAEERCIINCARLGVGTVDATMLVTHSPCSRCLPRIYAAGIARLVYGEVYRGSVPLASDWPGLEIVHLPEVTDE